MGNFFLTSVLSTRHQYTHTVPDLGVQQIIVRTEHDVCPQHELSGCKIGTGTKLPAQAHQVFNVPSPGYRLQGMVLNELVNTVVIRAGLALKAKSRDSVGTRNNEKHSNVPTGYFLETFLTAAFYARQ